MAGEIWGSFGRFLLAMLLSLVGTVVWKCFFAASSLTLQKRHAISFALGSLTMFTAFGLDGVLVVAIPSLLIYLLQGFIRGHGQRAVFGWVLMFCWLFCSHLRSASERGKVNLNGSLMVLVANICMLLTDLGEGGKQLEGPGERADISLLHILGYAFFWPCILAGPCMKMQHYNAFIAPSAVGNVRAGAKRVVQAFAAALVHLVLGRICSFSRFEGPFFDEQLPLWAKMFFVWGVAVAARCKYYFAWGFAEGLLWCLDVNGDGRGLFRQIRISHVEWASSPRDLISNWNISISSLWLYEYVYLRGGKSALLTNLVSACWHGFHGGYYIAFVSIAFAVTTWRKAFRLGLGFGPWLGPVITQFVMNGLLMPFVLLSARASLKYLRQVWLLPHIFVVALFCVCVGVERVKRVKRREIAVESKEGDN